MQPNGAPLAGHTDATVAQQRTAADGNRWFYD